jgi:hypothetical protein
VRALAAAHLPPVLSGLAPNDDGMGNSVDISKPVAVRIRHAERDASKEVSILVTTAPNLTEPDQPPRDRDRRSAGRFVYHLLEVVIIRQGLNDSLQLKQFALVVLKQLLHLHL